LLRRLNLAIDFPNNQIWQKKTPNAGLSIFPVNASGMAVVFVSPTQLKINKIRPQSPATLAEVEAGDEIVELQGKRPGDLSLFQVQELLAQDGKTIQVVFDKNGQRLVKDLRLKRPFLYPPVWEPKDEDSGEFEKFLEQDKGKSAAKLK
jgi:C-terminal processing protease CtpA/Prc